MDKVIKIILSLLAVLAVFLAGWLSHAWKNRNEVTKEVKKAIADLNKEHKKALKALKESYDEKLKKKDEIIKSLHEIIDRLINILRSRQPDNKTTANEAVTSLIEKLVLQKEELNNI